MTDAMYCNSSNIEAVDRQEKMLPEGAFSDIAEITCSHVFTKEINHANTCSGPFKRSLLIIYPINFY